MRNKFPGKCYRCGLKVEKGKGHFERVIGKGWRVQHADCAIKFRGTDFEYVGTKKGGEDGFKDWLWSLSQDS